MTGSLHQLRRRTLLGAALVIAGVVGFGPKTVCAQGDQPGRPPNAGGGGGERYWTTEWDFDNVDVARLLARLESIGLDAGVVAQGTVTASLRVGVPLTSLGDAAAYRFDGKLTSPRLVVDSVDLGELQTNLVYRDGVAQLTRLKATIVDVRNREAPRGQIDGSAAVALAPRGDFTARVDLRDVTIEPLLDLIARFAPQPTEPIEQGGTASGQLQLRAPLDEIRDLAAYDLQGALRWTGVRLAGLPTADVDVENLVVKDARLRLGSVRLESSADEGRGMRLRVLGQADLPLTAKGPFSFQLAGDDVPLAEAAALLKVSGGLELPDVAGKLDLRVDGSGDLAEQIEDSTWELDGRVASPSLRVAGVDLGVLEHRLRFTPERFDLTPGREADRLPDAFRLKEVRSEYRLTDAALELTSFSAKLFGGEASGRATLGRRGRQDLVANLTLSQMRPTVRLEVVDGFPATIAATLGGEIDWRAPLRDASRPGAHRGVAKLSAEEIRVNDAAVGELSVRVAADRGALSLESSGEMFGGTVDVESTADLQENDRWSDVPQALRPTQFRFDGVSIGPLIDGYLGRRAGLSGVASGALSVDPPARDKPLAAAAAGDLTIELADLAYGATRLSRRVAIEGRLGDGAFRLRSLTGDYAGGSVSAGGGVALFDSAGSFDPLVDMRVNARRIDAGDALWFAGDPSERIEGRVTAEATVSGDRNSLRVRGGVTGRDLAAYGVPIGVGHSALIATLDPRSFRWTVKLPSVRSSVGGGSLEGDVSLASTSIGGFDLRSRWKAQRMDVLRLSTQIGAPTSLASGDVSGQMTLQGDRVRGVNDLTGRFDFDLGRTRGAAVPGLIGVSRLLGPVSLSGEVFDAGGARGVIGRGAVTIDEFWLGSDKALVRADGKVYLASGRMDLEALVATGDYRDVAQNFVELAQNNALRVLLPASAVLSVSELLQDRTVVVAVTGTVRAPVVRLRPVETFREEVARFLLREGQRLILAGFAVGAAEGIDAGP